MFDLHNKIALVTGASGGIGAQIATVLHAQGATVVLHGTRASKLEALKEELGERTATVTANLANRDAVAGLFDAASEAVGGPINILVNNAGITRDGLLMRMKNDDWDDVLEVNLTASMILCRAAMRVMMKARSGRIISISSVVGVTGNPGQTNYAASKAGIIGFSKSLAAEVASRGRCDLTSGRRKNHTEMRMLEPPRAAVAQVPDLAMPYISACIYVCVRAPVWTTALIKSRTCSIALIRIE